MKLTKQYLKNLIFEMIYEQETISDVENTEYALISWNEKIEGYQLPEKKPGIIYPAEGVIGQRLDYRQDNGWIIVRKLEVNGRPQITEYFIPNEHVIIHKKLEDRAEAHQKQKLGNDFQIYNNN